MPRIVPLQLLKCLKVLLDDNGGILSESEVKRIAGLMTKYSKKLVSKCIYVQILKCTKTELLGEFMGAGGWSLTHLWLNDAIRAMNWPLVQEILELLLLCPVDVDRLKSNSAPKLVKGLCKDGGNEGVRILAVKLVEQWLKVVTSDTVAIPPRLNEVSAVAPMLSQTTTSPATKETESQQVMPVALSELRKQKKKSNSTEDEDPLADVGEEPPESYSLTPAQKKATESGLIYKIVVKDGQQVFAKIECKNRSNAPEDTRKNGSCSVEIEEENKIKLRTENDSRQIFDSSDSTRHTTSKESEDDNSNSLESKLNETLQSSSIDKQMLPVKKSQTVEAKLKTEIKENQKIFSVTRKDEKITFSSKDKKPNDSDRKSSSVSSHRSASSSSSHKSSSKNTGYSNKSSRSSSSSGHRNYVDAKQPSSSSSREKDRNSNATNTANKDKDSNEKSFKDINSRHKSYSGKSSRSSSKERHRSKDREKTFLSVSKNMENKDKEFFTSQVENDKIASKMTSSLDKFGRIPKKPREEDSSSNNTTNPSSITIPSKKASMSIEIRRDSEKAKTVKTYKSQFRSHGLTEEAPPPPSRKGLKKPTSVSLPGTAIPTTIPLLKRPSPPPNNGNGNARDSPVEKKAKIDINNFTVPNEKPGAIKLIAAKPKIQTLVETNLFSDALSAATGPKKDARKRKRPNTSSANKDAITSPPDTPKLTPLKFYQDTLDENKDEEKKAETQASDLMGTRAYTDSIDDDDDIPLKKVKDDIEEKVRREMNKAICVSEDKSEDNSSESIKIIDDSDEPTEANSETPKKPGPGCGPNGPPGVLMLHHRKGPKKKLMWRPQDQLEQIRYFDLDETERVNVTKNFIDMKNLERFSERDAINMSRRGFNHEDNMEAQIVWKPLVLIDDVPPQPEGNNSKERKVQADREQTTLRALYFSHAMIPDSPAEPDIEPHQPSEFTIIPLDDITANPDAVNDFTSMPWPDPKGSPQQDNAMDENGALLADMFGSGVGNVCAGSNNPFNPFLPFASQSNSTWPLNSAPSGPMQNNLNGINHINIGPPGMMCGPGGYNSPMGQPGMGLLGGPPSPSNMDMIGGGSLMGGPGRAMGNGMPPMVQGLGGPGGHNQFGPIGPQLYGSVQNFTPGGGNFGPPINMNMPINGPGPGMLNAPVNICIPGSINVPNDNNRRGGGNNHRGAGGNGNGNWRSGGSNFGNDSNWRSTTSGGSHLDRGNNMTNRGKDNWVSNNSNVCKQYLRSGSCRLGNKCKFLHPGKGAGSKTRY